MAYLRCTGTPGGSLELKSTHGSVASFETAIAHELVDVKSDIGYSPDGYTSARVINSATSPVLDKTPYLTRPLPLNAGNRLLDMIVGGTVAFNQLVQPRNATNTDYTAVCVFTPDGKATINGTPTGGTATFTTTANVNAIAGHVYLLLGGLSDNVYTVVSNVSVWGSSANRFDKGIGALIKALNSGTIGVNIQVIENYNCSNVVVKAQLIDLTALFGSSTIADYVYSLESGTAGAGVNWLKAHGFIAKDYYAYNSGTLVSVKPTKHIEYDSGNNVIGSYDLDTPDLYGLFKLDANNNLYADGNTYKANGEVGLKWGKKVFDGSENWQLHGAYANVFYIDNAFDNSYTNNNDVDFALTNQGLQIPYASISLLSDKQFCYGNASATVQRFAIKNTSCATVSDFQTYLSSHNLEVQYLLATPTTTTADPFTNPQVCVNGGSEEYTDTREYAVPIGHDSVYGTDMTVNEAEFGVTVYGGSIDFTTGELISNKNADGTDKTPVTSSITPVSVMANAGANNIFSDTNGDTTAQYLDLRASSE